MRNISKSIKQPIDSIRLSKSDREIAKAHMEDAERFAEVVLRITDGFKALIAAIGHRGRTLAANH